MALLAAFGPLNPRITASTLLACGPLSTPTLCRPLPRAGFWPVIASSLWPSNRLLIVPLGKPKTIISSVVSLVTAVALNVASSFPYSYQALLASMLLKVRAKALLRSFLTPVIRLSPLG
jgi:hypothetical protein